MLADAIASRPGVCDVEHFPAGAAPGARADLLIELPHGATESKHFAALRRRLCGDYPEDLKDFFFVNTDVGSVEVAREIASRIAGSGRWKVLLLRCLIPRTFIDCNRVLDEADGSGLTPPVPEYVTEPQDVSLLGELYEAYRQTALRAYMRVCGGGKLGVALHTYAPRSVEIEKIDCGIVAALRAAYVPDRYAQWKRRPAVDIISEDREGKTLASSTLVDNLCQAYARRGVDARCNATYRLERATMGYRHSVRHRGRVLCVEIRRDELAAPWLPFQPVRIAIEKVRAMAAPLAEALAQELERGS